MKTLLEATEKGSMQADELFQMVTDFIEPLGPDSSKESFIILFHGIYKLI